MSWLIDAIELAAMERALTQLDADAETQFKAFGVSFKQVRWLMRDYEARTGKPAHSIDHEQELGK